MGINEKYKGLLNPLRIIEINNFGYFYVRGFPKYIVISAPKRFPTDEEGFIIVSEQEFNGARVAADIHTINAVLKLFEDGRLPIPLLVRNREMAEEICFACNRIRV